MSRALQSDLFDRPPRRPQPQDRHPGPGLSEVQASMPVMAGGRIPSYLKGHRERLRKRLLDIGPGAFEDYELMELVLFRAIPNGDVKPLARQLLEEFGDFSRVVSAEAARLARIKGVGPTVIAELKTVEATAQRMARSRAIGASAISSWQALVDYCHTTMAHSATEHFRILFLDRKNVLIADEEQSRGTVDHVPVYAREVVKRALELNASALILVHNHPSGDPSPSEADIAMTQKIQHAAEALDLTVHDHLIVGKETEYSFRQAGLLD